jgi:multidrug efflux pump subunit AcrA (membrane-fusion protein)
VQQISVETAAEARAYTSVVCARYETDLGFRVAGKIVERMVNIGDHVDKDQLLARLDPSDYRLALESSGAELAAAKSTLAQAADRRSLPRLHIAIACRHD